MRRHRFGSLKISALLTPRYARLRWAAGRLAVDIAGVDGSRASRARLDATARVVALWWAAKRS